MEDKIDSQILNIVHDFQCIICIAYDLHPFLPIYFPLTSFDTVLGDYARAVSMNLILK